MVPYPRGGRRYTIVLGVDIGAGSYHPVYRLHMAADGRNEQGCAPVLPAHGAMRDKDGAGERKCFCNQAAHATQRSLASRWLRARKHTADLQFDIFNCAAHAPG